MEQADRDDRRNRRLLLRAQEAPHHRRDTHLAGYDERCGGLSLTARLKVDEVAVLIEQVLGYQMRYYLCPQVPVDHMLEVLDHLHIIHATPISSGDGQANVECEEHWLLHLPPDEETEVPAYVWRVIDLFVAHEIRSFWFWVAERVPADNQPVIDPRPLYCFSFDGQHVIAL